MRTLVLIAALLWGGISWWWYTCDIKGYCGSTDTTIVENKAEPTTPTTIATEQSKATEEPAPESETKNTNNSANDDKPDSTDTPSSNTTDENQNTTTTDTPEEETTSVDTSTNTADSSQESSNTDTNTDSEADTTESSADTTQTDDQNQEQTDTTDATDSTATQTDNTEEDIVSEDDNDPKKIRIDKVDGATTQGIQKARVYFPYSSSKKADLTGSATRYFDQVVEALKADKNLKIQLTGHTDNQGKAKNNQSLGLRRAETVKSIFVDKGVDKSQIETDSKGEDQPIASNKTESGRNKNRRVTVEVIQATE